MNFIKKNFIGLCAVIFIFACASCTSEINITVKENDCIEIAFSGASGNAFTKLINSASGEEGDTVIFDTKQISYELAKSGFSDVKVNSKNGYDLNILMNDAGKKSVLFSSKILNIQKGKITAELSPEKLKAFYDSSDEDIVQFLDLLLAPVFNDETMDADEYIETIASFYGDAAADEINDSNFKITLVDLDGNKKVKIIPIAELLSLRKVIAF